MLVADAVAMSAFAKGTLIGFAAAATVKKCTAQRTEDKR